MQHLRRQILTVRGDTFGVTSVKFIDVFFKEIFFFLPSIGQTNDIHSNDG